MAFQSAAHNMGLELDLRPDRERRSHRSEPRVGHSQPREQICAKMEQKYVHDVYNKTAHHFADVRYKAWPKVKEFLMNQDLGSIVADVGCGSGKYLNINKEIVMIGCDHSLSLVSMAHDAGHSALVCDNLYLPFRDHSFDAVISVGVIHHFTTPSRRAKAIRELSRVLRPGGKVMIYVWAMEQKHRKFKSQDVLVPWHLKLKNCKQAKNKNNQHQMKPSVVTQSLQEDSDEGDDDVFECENDSSMPPRLHNKKSGTSRFKTKHFVPDKAFLTKFRERNPCLQREQEHLLLKKYFNIRKKSAEPSVSNISASSVKLSPSPHLSKPDCVSARSDKCKEDSLTRTIKMKFLNFLGVESEQTVSKTRCSRVKMIEQIINSDHELSCQNGENIPLYLAKEGFAVREFPGSSQRKESPVVKGISTEVSRTQTYDAGTSTSDVDDSIIFVHSSGSGAAPCQSSGDKTVASHLKDGAATHMLDNGEGHPRENREITNIHNSGSGRQGFSDICTEWLYYGSSKLGSEAVLSVSDCNTDNSGNTLTNNSSLIETFPFAAHDDWVKLTTKAIEHVQSKVTAGGKITSGVRVKSKTPSPGLYCTCRGNARLGNHSTDTVNAKQSNTKSWNCSESSLSSISSDTDSNASDVEDVSLCVVCRGDSVSDVYQVEPALGHSGNSLKRDLPQSYPDDQLLNGRTIGTRGDGCRSDDVAKTFNNQCMVDSTADHSRDSAIVENGKIETVADGVCSGNIDFGLDSIRSGQLSPVSVLKSRDSKHIIPEASQRSVTVTGSPATMNGLNLDTEKAWPEAINYSLPQSSHNGISSTGAALGNPKAIECSEHFSAASSIRGHLTQTDFSNKHQSTDDPVEAAESFQLDNCHNTTSHTTDGAHKRFYHVFRENELDELIIKRVHSLRIIQSFYDHANWCIVAEKRSSSNN